MLRIRAVRDDAEDLARTLAWANDPDVITHSFSRTGELTGDEHAKWFKERVKLGSWWILEETEPMAPLGQIRVDWEPIPGFEPEAGLISLMVDQQHRGRGLGRYMLRSLSDHFDSREDARYLVGLIKLGNSRSVRLFDGCGYAIVASPGLIIAVKQVGGKSGRHQAKA